MAYNTLLDPVTHDFVMGRRRQRGGGLEYTVSLVKCRLLTILGESELIPNKGIPWLAVLERAYDISAVRHAVAECIRTTPGVQSLDTLVLQADDRARKLTVTFSATSIYGDIMETVTV